MGGAGSRVCRIPEDRKDLREGRLGGGCRGQGEERVLYPKSNERMLTRLQQERDVV